jgi:D-sedoheptulose 7-phosphate isomerase
MGCAQDYLNRLGEVLQLVPPEQVDEIRDVLLGAYEKDRRIFLFGNGGSAALASHFACDLGKGVTMGSNGAKRFRAIALTDSVPMMTAWANDSHYEDIFAEQLKNLIEAGDVAFAISASGNSRNVLKALEVARHAGGFCIGLGGYDGGQMKHLCDLCLVVPSDNMQLIEDLHLSIAHALFTTIRHRLETGMHYGALKLATVAR